ncbi:outer membrane beta-barrel protein [Pseudotenacibaculum sp. MALMAid0570]|uniref:outer membrane beta-barrel protein n=1 Tax=Pseudotenacibaculum sp. MALMAid0570 TaxID=3143938 RepID=UPI0032DEB99C
MKKIFTLAFLLCTLSMFAQSRSYTIEGILKSKSDSISLESATIHLEKLKDSSVVTYTISDKNGKFKLEGTTFEKELRLVASFVGYKSFSKKIIFDKKSIQLGTLELEEAGNLLDEIIVKSRAPITIKKDTLEFNVKSFKTKKDANVEDLLKKLPGVEVDEEGKITVNGKPVNKILVNGKPFFGDDPTITTRNLSKEIIEKVQITDTKTKSQAFTGEKGDDENKTINLTIKEENNKGYFGRLAAGKGTDDLYEFAGIVNRFNNNRRISILGGGNNLNSPGFSFGEIQEMFGGGNSISVNSGGGFSIDGLSFGFGSGIITSQNFGATFADEFGKGFETNGDYFYASSDSQNESTRNRETILPDGTSFFTNSESVSKSDSKSHRANLDFDIEIDSTFLINIRPSINKSTSNSTNRQFEESFDNGNSLVNRSTSNNFRESSVNNFRNRIDVTKRIGSKGSFLKFNMTNQIDKTEIDSRFNSDVEIFGTNPSTELRDQIGDEITEFNSLSTNATYRFPITAKKFFIDFRYSYRKDKRENERNTYDIDPTTNDQTFNTDLSTDFTFFNTRSTPSIDLTYRRDKWSMSFETGYVSRTLENSDVLRPTQSLKRKFNAIELSGNFNYRFSPKTSMYSGYSLSNRPPQLSQLRPFTDISNPLNTITGNPALKPSNQNRLYFGFNNFNFQKGTGIYSYFSGTLTNNQVVSKSTINDDLIRNTTYENVNGNYNIYANVNYSKEIKLDTVRKIKFRLSFGSGVNKAVNFFNDVKYTSLNTSFTPGLGLKFTWKDVFEIDPRYTISITKSNFNIDQFTDQNFTRHQLRIRTKTFAPKKLEWRNDIRFQYNPNVADGFQKSSWFWNSTLAYSLLKDKATLSLKAYDLLNQNTNARRRATANYIEDTQSTVLTQYFMLSFSWKFNTLGTKRKRSHTNFVIFD